MPRGPRVVLPNNPHHVIQRGHDRQIVFMEDSDFLIYLATLREWKKKLGCRVYAYCLMTNHVHLVVDPGDDPSSLGRLMKRLAGRHTRLVNRLDQRTGTAWEGRYKSSPIDTEQYLLACCRYIELNPCRAGMVGRPEDYRWSSYREKVGLRSWTWLDADTCYVRLGETGTERSHAYRALVSSAWPPGELSFIRTAVRRGQLTGDRQFIDDVERRIGRRIEQRGRGRPRAEPAK